MFHTNAARKAMQRVKSAEDDRRESPRFDVPLFVRTGSDGFRERFGRLSITGVYFETDEILMLGQGVEVRVALLGLGVEVSARGRVVSLAPAGSQVGVAACFDDIPFETERMIARWLDLMTQASRRAVAV